MAIPEPDVVFNGEWVRQRARDRRVARRAGFLWGFAEGLCFFIVPDVYVTFATLFSIGAGVTAWIASIVGSLVAVGAIYLLMSVFGVHYLDALPALPGISAPLITRVSAGIAGAGLPYTPLLILGGVPLKVYAGTAFSLGLSLPAVLVWTVFARVVRIAPVFALAASARLLFRPAIDQHPMRWCAVHLTAWLLFYVAYFWRMGW
jgi:hypothetical protein